MTARNWLEAEKKGAEADEEQAAEGEDPGGVGRAGGRDLGDGSR